MIKLQDIPLGDGTPKDGISKIVNLAGRPLVVAEVNGVNVPFYVSTGRGGKEQVPVGRWYPIMGIGADGWFNKGGDQNAINNYFFDEDLRKVAEYLDRHLGDLRADASIPKVPRVEGAYLSVVNRDMRPTTYKDYTEEQFRENIERVAQGRTAGRKGQPVDETVLFVQEKKIAQEIFSRTQARDVHQVSLLPDGSVSVQVTGSYSRRYLAEALGIREPAKLLRSSSDVHGMMEVIIPGEVLPGYLKKLLDAGKEPVETAPRNQGLAGEVGGYIERVKAERTVRDAPWFNVNSRAGAAKYISLEDISPAQRAVFSASLELLGIKHEVKSSTLPGNPAVIAVYGSDMVNVARLQDGQSLANPGYAHLATPGEKAAIQRIVNQCNMQAMKP